MRRNNFKISLEIIVCIFAIYFFNKKMFTVEIPKYSFGKKCFAINSSYNCIVFLMEALRSMTIN